MKISEDLAQWKLWLYTNYDCNLRCSYCVAKSSPNAPRRALGLANVQRYRKPRYPLNGRLSRQRHRERRGRSSHRNQPNSLVCLNDFVDKLLRLRAPW